ncbi:hypothetical protein BN000_02598 [Mycobacterium europaeum]|uniref:DUF4190 domain-containing protein n=1 Tax=Mycobacterium europaeum TaxID=761804 RepID=A0A0U1DBX5_9MYCO|nr:DUF4190 domain-containing protein [Mycobacterium europaeum]CQD12310.1 hypothetical protein BN000_02598 [Mycobacterium europaeum]
MKDSPESLDKSEATTGVPGYPPPRPLGPRKNRLGIASLVIAIVALLSAILIFILRKVPLWESGQCPPVSPGSSCETVFVSVIFVFGAVILGIIAVVIGIAARGRIKRGEADNGKVATAAIVLGFITAVAVLALFLFAFGPMNVSEVPVRQPTP